MRPSDNSGMEATLKSADTEEFIDIHFYRPAGYCLTLLCRKMGVSPNTVTVIAIILGVASGVCFYFGSIYINIWGMILLVLANTCDSADGQLARLTGKTSVLGRMLDGMCGDLWFASIYLGIIFRLYPQWGIWIWVLAAATGYCHIRQAALADYYRNIHLFFLKGRSGSELSDYATLRREYDLKDRKRSFFLRFAERTYMNYTRGQERCTPGFQRLSASLRAAYGSEIPSAFRAAFRLKSLPLQKYANLLSFNSRAIALFVGISMGQPWIYFIFELTVLNVALAYMWITHERFSSAFAEEIKSLPT